MKLKDHVEGCCLILNTAAQGPFLFDEETETFVDKNKIEHFVIIHAHKNQDELNDGLVKKKRKKKNIEDFDVNEAMAQQAADEEEDEDDSLGRDEEVAHLSGDKELLVIARRRKINQPSINTLNDDGWFLCPVYEGMTELRPMLLQILNRKKGYRAIISKKVLWNFGKSPFTKQNLKDWEVNSIFILNNIFDKEDNRNGLHAESIFLHKRIDMQKHDLKSSLSRLETTQKTRIKLGNILVDEVLVHVGQERFVDNKEKLALLKKDKKNAEDLKDYELNEVKIIKMITMAYNKINDKAEELGKKYPINREDTFKIVIDAVSKDDEDEHIEMAKQVILRKMAESLNIEVEDLDPESIPKSTEDFQKLSNWKEAYELTDILKSSEYISDFITYSNTKIYMNAYSNETDARNIITKLVHENQIWEYASGISGFGEVSAAYLEANIDWRAAIHPSSVIRYLGMDNVTDVPKRKDSKGHDIFMADSDLKRYIEISNLDVARKFKLKMEKAIDEINHDTFDLFLKSDVISNYGDFIIALDFYKKEFNGLRIADKEEKLENIDIEYIASKYPDYSQLLMRMWVNFDVVYTTINGITVPAVKKRARHKGDWVITTYIDKNGKVKFKKSMGYNPKMKSRVIEITFDSLLKAGNEYYVGNTKKNTRGLYMDKKGQYRARRVAHGENPDDHKMVDHLRARRYTMQVFIEELWKRRRQDLGLPLNGGTFYEAKLHGSHGHGFDPAVTA